MTVTELIPQIDALNGRTVTVEGFLPRCGGYDCTLFRDRSDSEKWDRYIRDVIARKRPSPSEEPPFVGIGSGENFEFDAKAAPFVNGYVLITGKVTDECRYQGKPACTDRTTDILPTDIRAWHAPAAGDAKEARR